MIPEFDDLFGRSPCLALDIGGTLTKVVCLLPTELGSCCSDIEDRDAPTIPVETLTEAIASSYGTHIAPGGLVVKTYTFTSTQIPSLITNLRRILKNCSGMNPRVRVTGGGAQNYAQLICDRLETSIHKIEEMQSLIKGLSFALRLPGACFQFELASESIRTVSCGCDIYPRLLVNIGSGVSIIRMDSPTQYERISGTALGGGTALGLAYLLLGCTSFDELIELSITGQASNVDLSVGSIMGLDVDQGQSFLSRDTLASSLGKVTQDFASAFPLRRDDLAQSIIRMISYNIGYVAHLVARSQGVTTLFFSGKFVHRHLPTLQAISYAIDFYRRNWCEDASFDVFFLQHEGYIGALGALLST